MIQSRTSNFTEKQVINNYYGDVQVINEKHADILEKGNKIEIKNTKNRQQMWIKGSLFLTSPSKKEFHDIWWFDTRKKKRTLYCYRILTSDFIEILMETGKISSSDIECIRKLSEAHPTWQIPIPYVFEDLLEAFPDKFALTLEKESVIL